MKFQAACLLAAGALLSACGDDDSSNRTPRDTSSFADAPEMLPAAQQSGKYRDDLSTHRGCTPRTTYAGRTENLVDGSLNTATIPAGGPANIPDYTCAAKEWTQPSEDTSKPIVILVHGNANSPAGWEEYDSAAKDAKGNNLTFWSQVPVTFDQNPREMLASKLIAAGYRVYGFDARTDLIKNADDPENRENNNGTMDHGWGTPLLQSMIKAVIKANPNRKISLVGHSLGVSLVRDALRRLFVEYQAVAADSVNPFEHIKDLVFLSGANHGVNYFGIAGACTPGIVTTNTMAITCNCELGNRDAYQPTYFWAPINGVNDAFATPCANGSYAFGLEGACGGNTVQYTTIVMRDKAAGQYQDEFVTETSAALNSGQPIDNHTLELDDYDTSGYYIDGNFGFLANHFGSSRSDAGTNYIVQKLGD